MEPSEIGQLWDSLIASAPAKTTKPSRSGLVALKLNQTAKPTELLRVSRTITEIDREVRAAIRSVVTAEAPWPLVLWGPPGTGKTCAALCLLDYAGGNYYAVPGLCSLLIQCQQGRLEWNNEGRGGIIWPEKFWSRLAAAPLIVLDELGCRGAFSDVHYEAVKNLIEERHCRPLVIISNVRINDLEKVYDARITSRLSAGTMIEVQGKDRRFE